MICQPTFDTVAYLASMISMLAYCGVVQAIVFNNEGLVRYADRNVSIIEGI